LRAATITPTYNERENIEILIPKIIDVFKEEAIDGEVIIVDDNSPDGTGKVAEELARKLGVVVVMNRPRKMGLGSAYKDGFKYALSRGHTVIIEIDADLSHNPADIPKFIRMIQVGCDLAIGSRYIPGGEIPKWSLFRRLASSFANSTARFLLRLTPRDVTSGYRAYNLNALTTIDLTSVKSDGYAFQVEMVFRCQKAGLKICEIPIAFTDRVAGESKLSKKEMWQFFKSLIQMIVGG